MLKKLLFTLFVYLLPFVVQANVPLLINTPGYEYIQPKRHYTVNLIYDSSEDAATISAILTAINEYNKAVQGLMEYTPGDKSANIFISVIPMRGLIGYANVPEDNSVCFIALDPIQSFNPWVVAHEMGHCMGLAHHKVNIPGYFMSPNEMPNFDVPLQLDKDTVEWLRKVST